MAIAAAGSAGSGSVDAATSLSFSFAGSAGSNRAMTLGVAQGDNPPATVTAVTWGGQSFITPPTFDDFEGVWPRVLGYYMKEATIAAGSGTTFALTVDSACQLAAFLQVFTGVDQTTSIGTPATASESTGTNASVTVSSATGEVVFGAISSDDEDNVTINGGTVIGEINDIDGDLTGAAGYWAGAASVSVRWDQSVSNRWAVGGFPLKPAAAAGRTTKNTRVTDLGMEIGMNWRSGPL